MVQPLLHFPSLSFSHRETPYYEETARSIEEKALQLEEKVASSLSPSDRRQKNRELTLQKAILLAALQDLRMGKISYHAFTMQCSNIMQTWDEILDQLSTTSFCFQKAQEQTLQHLALSTLSTSTRLYPDFVPSSSFYFPLKQQAPDIQTPVRRSTLLTQKNELQKELLQAAMKTVRVATVSLETAGIAVMGYSLLTGGAMPLAIGLVGVGACMYGIANLIDASMPASWKEALQTAPQRLEEAYGVSQEEVKQFMDDLSFLAMSAVAIPGIRAASRRCMPLLDALARSMKGSSQPTPPTPLLTGPGTWTMYLTENIQQNPYVAFFRDKDPTLYVCCLEKAGVTKGFDAEVEASLRTLAQDLKKEQVFLTFAQLQEPTAAKADPFSLPFPSFQRLLTARPRIEENPTSLFFKKEGEVAGTSIIDYFNDATLYPSSLEKLSTISLALGKSVGEMLSFPMGTAPVETIERDSQLLLFHHHMASNLAEDRGMTLPHSKEEILTIVNAFKQSTSPTYGFFPGKNFTIVSRDIFFEETSSQIHFLKPEKKYRRPSHQTIPEYRQAAYEFQLLGYMIGIGLDAPARNSIMQAWRQGYLASYAFVNPPERAAFYKTLAFYECFLDEKALKSPIFFSSLLQAYAPISCSPQATDPILPIALEYQQALKAEKNYLQAFSEGGQAVSTLSPPKQRLSSYLTGQQAVFTEFKETSYTVHLVEWEHHKLISKQAPLLDIQKELRMNTFFQSLQLSHSTLPKCLAVEIDAASSPHFPQATLYMSHQPGNTLEEILVSSFRLPSFLTSFEPTLAETALYHTAKALAELHGKAVNPGIPHLNSSLLHVEQLKKSFLTLSKSELLQGITVPHEQAFIEELSNAFLQNPGRAGYIHGDLHLRNILFDDKSKTTSLLDVGDSQTFLSSEGKPSGHPLENLYQLLFVVESLVLEEKASFSESKKLAQAIYQGYTSENTPFLSKEACRFYHLGHYYQQASLLLSKQQTPLEALPRQVFVYRMQKIFELMQQEPAEKGLFPIKQTEQDIAPGYPLWALGEPQGAIWDGSYRVAQSKFGETILAVNIDFLQGRKSTLSSLIEEMAKMALEIKADRIQITNIFVNEKLYTVLTECYGLRATKAPWVHELPIEELLKVSNIPISY